MTSDSCKYRREKAIPGKRPGILNFKQFKDTEHLLFFTWTRATQSHLIVEAKRVVETSAALLAGP